ncbi:hypothetical protein ABT282_07235 [Streptomyces sp. NPDC000927]|uniref:hypothetical protein n=1 Tax=Streptomyces sp. NPDC000927 TaxID=3154371 RepID=UPI00331B4EB2
MFSGFKDEDVIRVMEAAGVSVEDHFLICQAEDLVEMAVEMKVLPSGLGLRSSDGHGFTVTLKVGDILLMSDDLDARFVGWAGSRGVMAVRGMFFVVLRESRALHDALRARFVEAPF